MAVRARETARNLIRLQNVQRNSQTQNCILGPPFGGIKDNIRTLSKRFNVKKLCSRDSLRECQHYFDKEIIDKSTFMFNFFIHVNYGFIPQNYNKSQRSFLT